MPHRIQAKTVGLFSLVMLLLFAGVGIGLPMMDAVRFHGRGTELNGQAHFDPAGGCRDHAENCFLVFSSSTDRVAPALSSVDRLATPSSEIQLPLISTAVSHPVLRATTTRAPPALLA